MMEFSWDALYCVLSMPLFWAAFITGCVFATAIVWTLWTDMMYAEQMMAEETMWQELEEARKEREDGE